MNDGVGTATKCEGGRARLGQREAASGLCMRVAGAWRYCVKGFMLVKLCGPQMVWVIETASLYIYLQTEDD